MDFISLDIWFKIKFIPITQIKAHLLNTRHPFFFIYKKIGEKGAFINPQNLIINFNVHPDVGYNYINNLEYEINNDNTIRVLFLKFHEISHLEFYSAMKKDSSSRYLLNFELEKLDSHYDSIGVYKKGDELPDLEKKGVEIGEEGYAMEMFLYDSIAKNDFLLRAFNGLKGFYNVNLYIQNNFTELNKLIKDLFAKVLLDNEYNKKDSKVKEIKERNIKANKSLKRDNDEEIIKTPFYFFKNYPIEANY